MTIKELILENDNFAHSEEAFEIYKENAELNVLNAWIECQQHKAFSGTTMFTESEDNAVEEAEKKAEAKEEALHKKIWGTITKTARRVWNAILKLVNKILRVFGVMRMPKLTKAQKELLLKGEFMPQELNDVQKKISNRYREISYITNDSFTNLADRGIRNIAVKIGGEENSNAGRMAATQVAYFLAGKEDIIVPSVTMSAKLIGGGMITGKLQSMDFDKLVTNTMQDPDAAKIVAGYKAYSAYSAKDLEGATKSIQESIEKLEKMDLEASAKNEATAGLKVVIELVNRDLKIVTAMAQIQGYLKELGDKIAADANAAAEAEKK